MSEKLTCIIVDDEEMAIKVLQNHISKIDNLEVIATHDNAIDAFNTLQKVSVDNLFVDIQMPEMSGFGLLKTLPRHPQVIITTAHREYALESYDFKVSDYLLKPISLERLLKSLNKINSLKLTSSKLVPHQTDADEQNDYFYVKHERQHVKVSFDKILYVESLRNQVKIVTLEDSYTILTNISEMEKKLPQHKFCRIHRSFIVALSNIDRYNQTSVNLGTKILPIGNLYKKSLMARLTDKTL